MCKSNSDMYDQEWLYEVKAIIEPITVKTGTNDEPMYYSDDEPDDWTLRRYQSFISNVGERLWSYGFIRKSSEKEGYCSVYKYVRNGKAITLTFDLKKTRVFAGKRGKNSTVPLDLMWRDDRVTINGIDLNDYYSAERFLESEVNRFCYSGENTGPTATDKFRVFRAKRKLLKVDEKYAQLIKNKLEKLLFTKKIVPALLGCACVRTINASDVARIGENCGFDERDVDLDFDNMLCTISLNDTTKARIRIVDKTGIKSITHDRYGGPRLAADEPYPTPPEEIEAAKNKPADPEAIRKSKAEIRAAHSPETLFAEGSISNTFCANVRLHDGTVVPITPELIVEYFEKQYVFIRQEDIKIFFDRRYVRIAGRDFDIADLTGDETVIYTGPKRRKGK